MDDRHVENLLRKGWDPKEPEGMRDRILREARAELRASRTGWRAVWLPRWKLALAGFAVVSVLVTNVSESARDSRITEMVCGETECGAQAKIASSLSYSEILSQQRQIESLLAQSFVEEDCRNKKQGGSL